jgi:hypothetical protein
MLAISLPMSMLSGASTSDLSRNVLSSSEGMSPEVRELVRSIPPTVFAVLGSLFFLATGSVVSTVGGVLGAAFFRRSVPPPPPDDIERGPSPGGWTPPEPAPPLPLPPPPPPEPAPGGEPVAGERPTGDPPS